MGSEGALARRSAAATLAQFHQHLFGDRLERVKDADAAAGDALEERFVAAQQFGLQLVDGDDVRQVALVQLQHVWQLGQLVAMLFEVGFEVEERLDVGVHALALRVGDKDDAVNAFKDQLAAGVIEDLAGHCVKVKAGLEAAHGAKVERQEVEKERAVGFRRQADELALGLLGGRIIDELQVGGLAAEARPVINNLAIDLARGVVDERQGLYP